MVNSYKVNTQISIIAKVENRAKEYSLRNTSNYLEMRIYIYF